VRLLDENQIRTYRKIREAMAKPFGQYILRWARRTGKTWLLMLVAIEELLRRAGIRVNVAAATKEALRQFIWPTVFAILATCPQEFRSESRKRPAKGELRIRTNKHLGSVEVWHGPRETDKSEMILAGCNDARAVERLRGPFSHLNILEEAGAIPEDPGMKYVLGSILGPQLLTTSGATLIAGTPPKSSGHEYTTLVRNAEAQGEAEDERGISWRKLEDNPRLTPELKRAYLEQDAKRLGLTIDEYLTSPDYRREWLAIFETDPRFAILPNFTEDKAGKCACDGWHDPGRCPTLVWNPPERTVFVDRYTSMDIGFSPHFTGILYASWNFARQELLIEGERVLRLAGSPEIATAVREDEVRLWGNPARGIPDAKPWQAGELTHPPYLRVADNNNPILLRDLAGQFGCDFQPTAKDDKDAAIADVRRWIGERRIVISTECPLLRAQMLAGVWNKAHTGFAESLEFGHFDLVDALIYLVRNVLPNVNRMPRHWGRPSETHAYIPEFDTEARSSDDALRSLFDP
jgi:hypothetical protein